MQAARESAGHRVLVAVTVGQRPGLLAMNPVAFWEPFGPPVLQVDSEVQAQLSVHAENGSLKRTWSRRSWGPRRNPSTLSAA